MYSGNVEGISGSGSSSKDDNINGDVGLISIGITFLNKSSS